MTVPRSCTPSTWASDFGPQRPMTPTDNPFCQIAELDTGQCGDIPVTPPQSVISKYWEPDQGIELDTRQSSLMYQAAPGISQRQDSWIMSRQTAAPSMLQSDQRMDQVNGQESSAYQAPTPTSPIMRLPTILRPGILGSWQPVCGTEEARREEAPRGDDFEEEDDPEVAFYKDLRQQEEERQHRRAVSRNDNNSIGRNSWA
jgi:hypothetical protein